MRNNDTRSLSLSLSLHVWRKGCPQTLRFSALLLGVEGTVANNLGPLPQIVAAWTVYTKLK